MRAHGEWAEFRIEDDGRMIGVVVDSRSEELGESFADEFCNYVLGCERG